MYDGDACTDVSEEPAGSMMRTLLKCSRVSRMGTRGKGVGPRLLTNQHKIVASYVSADGKADTRRKQVTTE